MSRSQAQCLAELLTNLARSARAYGTYLSAQEHEELVGLSRLACSALGCGDLETVRNVCVRMASVRP